MSEIIYKNSCWTCKRAQEDPDENYTCPKIREHWNEYEKQQKHY